ncbi:MAG: hypothetical protein ACD_26C00033G0003 [uncultured bacterium]|nr:MAG: hypothetical protein ACD_26C00033G0003 [uncultured bacterium]
MNKRFTSTINDSISKQDDILVKEDNIINHKDILNNDVNINSDGQKSKFKLTKTQKNKIVKKAFPLYLEDDKSRKLDSICKKIGLSKNELINKMIDYSLENLELEF